MCQRCHLAYDADHHAETRRRIIPVPGQLSMLDQEDPHAG